MLDLISVLGNLTAILPQLEMLLMLVSYLMGIIFIYVAVTSAQKRQDAGRNSGSWGAPLTSFIVGGIFLAIPTFLRLLTYTVFGMETPDPQSILAFSPVLMGGVGDSENVRQMITAITSIVMIVGLIAIMRGLYLLNNAAKGGHSAQTMGQGATFVGAGIIGVNFPLFVGALENFVTG